MTREELNTELYKKMFAEQESFRDWLKSQPPEEILSHAYSYTVREDILMALEYMDLESSQAKMLLSSPTPLEDVYAEFEKRETNYMDVVRDCIESRAEEMRRQQREHYLSTPVYPYPASYARENGELEQYRESHRANMDCKIAIEEAISEYYHDNCLHDGAVQDVVELFGFDRTMYVLANTVQQKDWDGRISAEHKAWARTIPVYPDENGFGNNRRLDFVVDRAHPGLTDIFIRQVRREYLLTQPLTPVEIANEAHCICEQMKSAREPNSPSGTHFMVQISPDFMARAASKDTRELQKWLPYQSLALTTVKGHRGTFALVSADEDRSQPLRSPKERKPSVRKKLQQPVSAVSSKETPQKAKGQER